ncbi:MAG: peptidase M28, partial [Sphaerobacter thermophilus]
MDRLTTITQWTDPELEREIVDAISLDVPWKLIEDFSTLHRLSGSEDERRAIELIIEQLKEAGIP